MKVVRASSPPEEFSGPGDSRITPGKKKEEGFLASLVQNPLNFKA